MIINTRETILNNCITKNDSGKITFVDVKNVYLYDISKNKEVWQYNVFEKNGFSPIKSVFGTDGNIYVVGSEDLLSISEKGYKRWHKKINYDGRFIAKISDNIVDTFFDYDAGAAYIYTTKGNVFSIDARGKTLPVARVQDVVYIHVIKQNTVAVVTKNKIQCYYKSSLVKTIDTQSDMLSCCSNGSDLNVLTEDERIKIYDLNLNIKSEVDISGSSLDTLNVYQMIKNGNYYAIADRNRIHIYSSAGACLSSINYAYQENDFVKMLFGQNLVVQKELGVLDCYNFSGTLLWTQGRALLNPVESYTWDEASEKMRISLESSQSYYIEPIYIQNRLYCISIKDKGMWLIELEPETGNKISEIFLCNYDGYLYKLLWIIKSSRAMKTDSEKELPEISESVFVNHKNIRKAYRDNLFYIQIPDMFYARTYLVDLDKNEIVKKGVCSVSSCLYNMESGIMKYINPTNMSIYESDGVMNIENGVSCGQDISAFPQLVRRKNAEVEFYSKDNSLLWSDGYLTVLISYDGTVTYKKYASNKLSRPFFEVDAIEGTESYWTTESGVKTPITDNRTLSDAVLSLLEEKAGIHAHDVFPLLRSYIGTVLNNRIHYKTAVSGLTNHLLKKNKTVSDYQNASLTQHILSYGNEGNGQIKNTLNLVSLTEILEKAAEQMDGETEISTLAVDPYENLPCVISVPWYSSKGFVYLYRYYYDLSEDKTHLFVEEYSHDLIKRYAKHIGTYDKIIFSPYPGFSIGDETYVCDHKNILSLKSETSFPIEAEGTIKGPYYYFDGNLFYRNNVNVIECKSIYKQLNSEGTTYSNAIAYDDLMNNINRTYIIFVNVEDSYAKLILKTDSKYKYALEMTNVITGETVIHDIDNINHYIIDNILLCSEYHFKLTNKENGSYDEETIEIPCGPFSGFYIKNTSANTVYSPNIEIEFYKDMYDKYIGNHMDNPENIIFILQDKTVLKKKKIIFNKEKKIAYFLLELETPSGVEKNMQANSMLKVDVLYKDD